MKNITVSLDDETYLRERIKAAAEDPSVSAVVKRFLVEFAAASPALMLMSQEEFERRQGASDPRRAYALDELPADLAKELAIALEAVTPNTYGDDR